MRPGRISCVLSTVRKFRIHFIRLLRSSSILYSFHALCAHFIRLIPTSSILYTQMSVLSTQLMCFMRISTKQMFYARLLYSLCIWSIRSSLRIIRSSYPQLAMRQQSTWNRNTNKTACLFSPTKLNISFTSVPHHKLTQNYNFKIPHKEYVWKLKIEKTNRIWTITKWNRFAVGSGGLWGLHSARIMAIYKMNGMNYAT